MRKTRRPHTQTTTYFSTLVDIIFRPASVRSRAPNPPSLGLRGPRPLGLVVGGFRAVHRAPGQGSTPSTSTSSSPGLGLRGTLGSPKHRASCTVQHGPQGPPRTTRRSDFFISRPGGAHRGRRRLHAWLKASVAAGSQLIAILLNFPVRLPALQGRTDMRRNSGRQLRQGQAQRLW